LAPQQKYKPLPLQIDRNLKNPAGAELQMSSCSADYRNTVLVPQSFKGLKSDGKGLQSLQVLQ